MENQEKPKQSNWKAGDFITIIAVSANVLLALFALSYNSKSAATQTVNSRVTDKMIQLYDSLMPTMNLFWTYVSEVNDYSSTSPVTVLEKKRDFDRIFFTYKKFLSDSLQHKIRYFVDTLIFSTYNESTHAQIRSGTARKKIVAIIQRSQSGTDSLFWQDAWEEYFTNEKDSKGQDINYQPEHRKAVEHTYYAIMDLFTQEIRKGGREN